MKQIKPSLSLTLILQSVFILLKIIVNFQGDQSKNTLILPKESTSWLATQHTLKIMSLQRKKLSLLKSLKILIDCMSSTGLKKKVLVNWMPDQRRKNTQSFQFTWSRERFCFQVYKKQQQKKCLNSPFAFYFLKCEMKIGTLPGPSQTIKLRFFIVLTMKTSIWNKYQTY